MSYPPIDLPWPDKALSPNARVHWSKRAAKAKHARLTAFILSAASIPLADRRPRWPKVAMNVTFCPPDNRRRDLDNCIASLKHATDGISDAIGIDDRHFIPTYAMGEPVKGGLVRVSLSETSPVIVESVK